MSFFENNLLIDSKEIYNSNIINIQNYHLTSEYKNHHKAILDKAYTDNNKLICNSILKHFNNLNNDINTDTYKEPLLININSVKSEDVKNLLLTLTNKGYTPLIIVQNGQTKLQI